MIATRLAAFLAGLGLGVAGSSLCHAVDDPKPALRRVAAFLKAHNPPDQLAPMSAQYS